MSGYRERIKKEAEQIAQLTKINPKQISTAHCPPTHPYFTHIWNGEHTEATRKLVSLGEPEGTAFFYDEPDKKSQLVATIRGEKLTFTKEFHPDPDKATSFLVGNRYES